MRKQNALLPSFHAARVKPYLRGQILLFISLAVMQCAVFAQAPRSYTSSEILLQLKKINVLGSVLYIAAHPDDENTRLLAWLANEKLYRTGYLSLTRGDGGQNLIGDEQGVDLGLIRTQELLSARRIDGAEQFFSRAFDFGFSKSPEEALRIWGHDKILSDVVWVIRKFRPDVIITRFPTTGEGGHGHHTASAILAEEAFDAAADPAKFPEQLQAGVTVWQAKRLLWNTFNFGGTNTQNENQFKMDCGEYNPVLGKSYGEIAAASRSQHKSQGFGVPAQRGTIIEYFKTIKGNAPERDLMDGVDISWDRLLFGGQLYSRPAHEDNIQRLTDSIVKTFSVEHPENSIGPLVRLYKRIESANMGYWRDLKLEAVKKIIENCSGLFMEATTGSQYAVLGDSLKITMVVNNRLGAVIDRTAVQIDKTRILFDPIRKNVNSIKNITLFIKPDTKITQPYWLEKEMEKGSFTVSDQQQVGKGESDPWSVEFKMMIEGTEFSFKKPVTYKYTDPVKGELYQPVSIVPPLSITPKEPLVIALKDQMRSTTIEVSALRDLSIDRVENKVSGTTAYIDLGKGGDRNFQKNQKKNISVNILPGKSLMGARENGIEYSQQLRTINYDHIPSINYLKPSVLNFEVIDVKTTGNLVGYIPGAGDKIPEALMQMGYKVITLHEQEISPGNLKQFDAIVTGVRAYNTQPWLNNAYDALMQFVKEGGVLLVQYNTNNSLGPVKAKIAPFPFTIGAKRITDETAKVNFLLPDHPVLNFPNKITQKDFEGWIQERSTYHAENIDSNYRRILSMKDPGETEDDGSLIIANYGKGRFVYTGLVFFRELPAGVPGAYRLFANLIANDRNNYVK